MAFSRFAWIFYLVFSILAALTHLALLAGVGDQMYGLLRYPFLIVFVTVCAFAVARPEHRDRLYSTTARKAILGGLQVISVAYSVLLVLDYLGFKAGESLVGSHLLHLWSTSTCTWVFALESMQRRIGVDALVCEPK